MAIFHGAKTAVQYFERSQLSPQKIQRELMGDDIDLEKLTVYLKSQIQFDLSGRIIQLEVTRDIAAASTVKLTVDDYDRTLIHSRRLIYPLDIQIDGMWFRLVKVERTAGQDSMDLTFEQREIAILRTYPKKGTPHNGVIFADRSQVTRAEFILRLIREVKEFMQPIPVVIPELGIVQPIQKASDAPTWGPASSGIPVSGGGVPTDNNMNSKTDQNLSPQRVNSHQLTVKGVAASADQIRNANTIIATGISMAVKAKLLVAAIMTATDESTLHNDKSGDNAHGGGIWDSAGLFQQTGAWGSYAERTDPAAAARAFYKAAIQKDRFEPDMPVAKLCSDIQRDHYWNTPQMGSNYAPWEDEAKRWVMAYGVPGLLSEGGTAGANLMGTSAVGGSDFLYYRGIPKESQKVWQREDSWTCIQRLAGEVQWRAFFISGVFYYIDDDDLFKTQPIMIFDESSPGIQGLGFDIDIGKKTSTITINADVGSWLAPPGAVVVVRNCGPANGRWLVSQFDRNLYDTNPATITAIKPLAALPEPLTEQVKTPPSWANVDPANGPIPSTSPQQATWAGIDANGSAQAVVAVAKLALAEEAKHHYCYPHEEGGDGPGPARPIPSTLFGAAAHRALDCSAFATLCYKEAGAPDPNGSNYNGQGYTGTLIRHGKPVFTPAPGDLVFYGGTLVVPEHVAVYIGGGMTIEIGSSQGILKVPWNYRPVLAVRRYIGLVL